jgi:hypothetical protein
VKGTRLAPALEARLVAFARALVDQRARRVLVKPLADADGCWFGAGCAIAEPGGRLLLCGRYRNPGDSRQGLAAGARGVKLAILASDDAGASFREILSFDKAALSTPGRRVVSIEGSALEVTGGGARLYVSSEKQGLPYPRGYEAFQKPGTGVWSIDVLEASTPEGLAGAEPLPLLSGDEPTRWHVKDPALYRRPDGAAVLTFCTHPFSWASTNSAYAVREARAPGFGPPCYDWIPRGAAWDVAITRLTGLLDVPRAGAFAAGPDVTLGFYDGGECLRSHEEHARAWRRPRGYSCEEIGGLVYFVGGDLSRAWPLSAREPLFVSPWGTGCSRYVSALATGDALHAFWQQSQEDRSQPLVTHALPTAQALRILS